MEIERTISKKTGLESSRVAKVLRLLSEGATIPFIARYRKEMTGSMDETIIADIRDMRKQLLDLADRKSAILNSLKERNLLTPELEQKVTQASTLSLLEDLYEKFRPRKKTRASMARERGLNGLAGFLIRQTDQDPEKEAQKYVDASKEVDTPEKALSGARDIIAEAVSDHAANRSAMRRLFKQSAMLRSAVKRGKEEEAVKYKDYFEWQEPAFKAPSHRILAMLRGKSESVLSLHVLPDEIRACEQMEKKYVKNRSASAGHVSMAVKDSYKRLLSKAMETQCLGELKQKADMKAIQVFTDNIRSLLLSSPMGQKRVLAIDPGFRTGCKVVCLDGQGSLLHHDVIYPHSKNPGKDEIKINNMVRKFQIEAVAIGNGTAGRETHDFLRKIEMDASIPLVMVDESGASVYSASQTARDEFPDHDITVRGAVSIGRRLMDPLAELVKIDPRSIGVGQYQHDVDQKMLNAALDDTVVSCVNQVGVEANTASKELLTHVAGLNRTIAANIVKFRDENGPFNNRKELLKVPRLGPKAYEQAAGFIRIRHADHPLDNSGIHPESYAIVEKMAADEGLSVDRLMNDKKAVNQIDLNPYITETVGIPTLEDIKKELLNPGLDPRETFENVVFKEDVNDIKDLVQGMTLNGIVTNVTAFGAFVDIGVHQDGLVHISQMADHFVKDPKDIVTVRQKVHVTVIDIDVKRKRISLSMKKES